MSTATDVSRATPEQVLEAVVEGINTGDFEMLMALYEPGAAFAFGLGLFGHRALHGVRQGDILDLDRSDLDAPGIRLTIDDFLEGEINFLPLGQQFIEFRLTEKFDAETRLHFSRLVIELVD